MASFPIFSPSKTEVGPQEIVHFTKIVLPMEDIYPSVAEALANSFANREVTYIQLLEAMYRVIEATPDEAFMGISLSKQQVLERIKEFGNESITANSVYIKENKPNPDGVMWPREEAFQEGGFEPFTQAQPIMTANTAIGAAGSCFAHEISYALQEKGFNYVISEALADGQKGVMNDAHLLRPDYTDASAQWGILFNTPSFKQLVEKAFGLREFPKLLTKQVNEAGLTVYSDPYRESIFFDSPESYEADYPTHLAAVRDVFLKSEVFVITPGLNECWEYLADGSVLSRNPRDEFLRALCRPKVLTVQDNIEALTDFIDIVRRFNPTIKFIISLSPVPFLATTRGDQMHVTEANTLSKSVLRVAIDEVVRMRPDVYYFPSYEYVTVCRDDSWEADRRHVRRPVVRDIISLFEKTFVQ